MFIGTSNPHGRLRTIIRDMPHRMGVGIHVVVDGNDGNVYVAHVEGVKWEKIPEGAMLPSATFLIRNNDMPDFYMELTRAVRGIGVCNDVEAAIKGELKATERHLEDMRALVEKLVVNPKSEKINWRKE